VSILVEGCVDSIRSVKAALAGGAGRLELCADRASGGTTPSEGMITVTRDICGVPLAVMIRPRPGDFVYDAEEYEIMRRDVMHCRELGVEGVVLGLLTASGEIDVPRTTALTALARPMDVVFHRAIDRTPDAERALDQLIEMGIDRVLTSGQGRTALEGVPMLARLVTRAAGRITVLAGGNVRPENVRAIVDGTGVLEVHSSGAEAGGETSEEVIRAIVKALGHRPQALTPEP
jgi:copper homeostasis protein